MTRCGFRTISLDLGFRMKTRSSLIPTSASGTAQAAIGAAPAPPSVVVMIILAAMALAAVAPGIARAAGETSRSLEYDLLFPRSGAGTAEMGGALTPEIAPPLEQPIDPETYRMAPGDLLELAVGGEADRTWRLAVSAEGMLLVPGSSAIVAKDRSLAELVAAVRAELSPRFPNKPIDLHLLQPGAFRVPVTGQVGQPGIQSAHGYDRVSAAIALAGGPLEGASIRTIAVTSADGTTRTVDLVAFAILGQLDQNPFLSPGMSIQVPPARDYVLVSGAVRGLRGDLRLIPAPGSRIPEMPMVQLEWKEGDTALSAITRAGGLSQDAAGTILFVRGTERKMIDIAGAGTLRLQSGDALEAAVRERWVYVNGAVRYPGPYPHLSSYKAADYVRLAGGPTEIGRGSGWSLRLPGSDRNQRVGDEEDVPPGSTIHVPERWTYRASSVLTPLTGVTALVLSIVALIRA
jgi:protein involved in polysaccharide export with SLBB domain